MVDLLRALHFRRVVREILVHGEGKDETAPLVHALVGLDRECEVEDVVRVREVGLHRRAERELAEIYRIRKRVSVGWGVKGVKVGWKDLAGPAAAPL